MKVAFETRLSMEELAGRLGADLCPSSLGIQNKNACHMHIIKPVLCKDCWREALQEVEDGKTDSNQ